MSDKILSILVKSGQIGVALALIAALVIIVQTTLQTTGNHMSEYGAGLRDMAASNRELSEEIKTGNALMLRALDQNNDLIQQNNELIRRFLYK